MLFILIVNGQIIATKNNKSINRCYFTPINFSNLAIKLVLLSPPRQDALTMISPLVIARFQPLIDHAGGGRGRGGGFVRTNTKLGSTCKLPARHSLPTPIFLYLHHVFSVGG